MPQTVKVKNASDLCPSPHLEAADFVGDTVVTIRGWEFHEVGQEEVERGVLLFKEHTRGMVLNRTNTKRIIAMYGNELKNWRGKRITLYPSETDFQGRTVPCIRVRERPPE